MYEIKVTAMCDGQNDNYTYLGGGLELPASKETIRAVMGQAGVTDEYLPHTAQNYECRMDYLNKVMPEKCRLDEMNYLAQRLSDLSEYERMKFEGAAVLSNNKEPAAFINLTYNLENYEVVSDIGNDEQLGRYYLEVHKFGALKNAPSDFLKYLDYEKLGCLQRESENGVYVGGNYIKTLDISCKQVYDGSHIPEEIKDTGYYIKLRLTSEREPDGTWLKLPADEDELHAALNKLEVNNVSECAVGKCVSILPKLEESISQHPDLNDFIDKANNLSYGIDQMPNKEMTAKFKAALIYEDCTNLDFAADITQNLDCYDFYSSLSSAEEYGRKLAFEKGYLKSSESEIISCFDFKKYGREQMAHRGVMTTEYGMVARNENEFYFTYYTPTQQQMI